MNAAIIRSPDRQCLVCGCEAAGHRLLDVHPADDPVIQFQLEIPLCDGHRDHPEADLIPRFQESYRYHQAHQDAAAIQEQARELLKSKCVVCDRPPHGVKMLVLDDAQARLMEAEPGSIGLMALCQQCGEEAGPDLWLDAVVFEQEKNRYATT